MKINNQLKKSDKEEGRQMLREKEKAERKRKSKRENQRRIDRIDVKERG